MSFIYVGRLDELKGIKVLFEAWRRVGTTAPELVVWGSTNNGILQCVL